MSVKLSIIPIKTRIFPINLRIFPIKHKIVPINLEIFPIKHKKTVNPQNLDSLFSLKF